MAAVAPKPMAMKDRCEKAEKALADLKKKCGAAKKRRPTDAKKPKALMSVLRRHRILADDVRRVMSHLKANGKVTPNDILNRPRLKKKKGASAEEEIPWSHADLAGSWQRKDLAAGPKGANVLYALEEGRWKLVVPEEAVASFLRQSLLDPKSTMPLGRDSAYHHVQKGTIGVSRRSLHAFLQKQAPLQVSRNIPNETAKGGISLTKRGFCEMDLIEGKGRDLYKNFGAQGDWYWLAIVDVLTGYGLVGTIRRKAANVVAPKLRELLDLLEYKLGAKVTKIAADHGREFYKDVRTLCKKRRITLKQVPRGSRVEKFNQDFQRNFYRLLRLRRGNFGSLEDQAMELTNNTKSKHTKKTPIEALDMPDADLVPGYENGRARAKPHKLGPAKVGDKCRYLIKLRKNIKPILKIGDQARLYKSYHGRHWTKKVHTITAMFPKKETERTKNLPKRYYVNGSWRNRDQLLIISGTDGETERQVAARPKTGAN
jgi:hypothetical protein